mgnify:CR=1 FL=1
MKKSVSLSLKALALTLLASSAFAADLPTHKAPPPLAELPPLWTGVYAGLNLGGGWNASGGNNNDWYGSGFNNGVSNRMPAGAIGGGQIGYNYQFSRLFVAGVEADFQGTTMGSGSSINNMAFYTNRWGYSMGTSLNWYGTVRGRAAIAVTPSLLLFGTAGFAYGNVSRNGLVLNGGTQTGWTAGGGVEWMFLPNWSAKAEYLYTNLSGGPSTLWGFYPSLRAPVPMNVNTQTAWNTIRAGVNYHFALGATTSITGAPITTPSYDTAAFSAPAAALNAPQLATGRTRVAQASYQPASVAAPVATAAPAPVAASPIAGLAPATGTMPDISFSDIIHP